MLQLQTLVRLILIVPALVLVDFAALPSPALAQIEMPPEPVRVVTKEIEPFVSVAGATPSGFSIELWNAMALDAGIPFDYVIVDTVQEQLAAVESGEADAAIAAITITQAREEQVDFSFSYFDAGLGILIDAEQRNHPLLGVFSGAFAITLLELVAVLAAIIAISAHVVWLTERHRPDSDFPSAYLPGIWEGIWWSAVTVTTVGYGDRTPRSVFGRFFGLIWMFAGLFIIANFTAAVTTQLTVNEIQSAINGPSDLYGKRVGTVAGSTAADWLAEHNIPHVSMDVVEDAYDLLETGRVDAVVYDYPVLKYYAVDAGDGQVEVTGGPFNEENYGIAFATGSPLREEMNRALLHLYESGFYDTLYFEWFGEDPSR